MTFAIESIIKEFKIDLRQDELNLEQIFQKYIIDGESYFFTHHIKNLNLEYNIKNILSESLNVHLHDIKIVGSGKLGFSINPEQFFQKFDEGFSKSQLLRDKSDIDIAIVSPELFTQLGNKLYNFTNSYKKQWNTSHWYPEEQDSKIPLNYKYFKYYTKGWIRPDLMPLGFEICENNKFHDIRSKLIKICERKVEIGIYQNWFYFKNYHINNLQKIKFKLKKGEIL